MKSRGFTILCLSVLLAAWGVSPVLGQTGSMRVQVVSGSDGEPLPGATVILTNTLGLLAETSALTDDKGTTRFQVLRSGGGYIVDVSFPGFAPNPVTYFVVVSGHGIRKQR